MCVCVCVCVFFSNFFKFLMKNLVNFSNNLVKVVE